MEQIDECESILGYRFRDQALLKNCLTHASLAPTRLESNERLEFLGDAILGTIVCERLFHDFPTHSEGELTKIKSVVVSRQTCADVTKQLQLEKFVRLGKGFDNEPSVPDSILAGVFESLIAGMYLDGGYDVARDFVLRVMNGQIERAEEESKARNAKSHLQQLSQREYSETPVYSLIDEKGPDHSKSFKVAARIGPKTYSAAWGTTKKEAEQKAASNALNELLSNEDTDDVSPDVES